MSAGGGDPAHQSEFTIPYHNSSIRGTTHWFIWFGLARGYQLLPTRTYILLGAFGLTRPPFTKAYQVSILGLRLPS
jgi:hypothetical protein